MARPKPGAAGVTGVIGSTGVPTAGRKAGGRAAAKHKGWASNCPRRLNTLTLKPSAAPALRPRRKGAGEDWCWALQGRSAHSAGGWGWAPAWAARCKRRRLLAWHWGSQTSKAARSRQRKACSAAHRRSAGVWACTQRKADTRKPWLARAGK